MLNKARIAGVGSYLPANVMTNDDLAKIVETSDAWIQERTGIKRRHIAAEGELTSDLGIAAARAALADAQMDVSDIDLLIVATTTPDYTFPSTGTIIQNRLEMHHGAAFDVQAVCSGFVYALTIANNFIACGQAQNVLVIGAETFSRLLNWEDRTTCVLFGDGAGAMVLSKTDDNDSHTILKTLLRSDGRYKELLHVNGGPSSTQTVGTVEMIGNQVFRHAVADISGAMKECAESADIDVEEIDWFVPHQANQRILDGVARRLKVSSDRVISTVAEHANTSAASIPLAFAAAVQQGRIKRGDLVMLEAFGGGFTWGAALLRY